MPITVPGVMGVLVPSIVFTGPGVFKYSKGVAIGLTKWARTIQVSTTDTGTAGAGTGILPLIVPQPLLFGHILAGMKNQKLLGLLAVPFIVGVSTGLNLAFLQMVINTTHPSVGAGAGLASFKAPPATPFILEGFKLAGMKGDGTAKKARALAFGLDKSIASLVIPIPIVGPPSPSPSSGVGSGSLA